MEKKKGRDGRTGIENRKKSPASLSPLSDAADKKEGKLQKE